MQDNQFLDNNLSKTDNQNEMLQELSKSLLLEKNANSKDPTQENKELDLTSFMKENYAELDEKNQNKQEKIQENILQENSKKEASAFEIYHAKKYGYFNEKYPELAYSQGQEASLGLNLKKLSGDKEFQELKAVNNALGNLNTIISLSDDTSGTINAIDRGLGYLTGNFLTPSEKNILRTNAESSLKANYLNAVSLRSGGTVNERNQISRAIDFGAMNAEDTRHKASDLGKEMIRRQNILLNNLAAKGYAPEAIFQGRGTSVNEYQRNYDAHMYLQSKKSDFKQSEFDAILQGAKSNSMQGQGLRRIGELLQKDKK